MFAQTPEERYLVYVAAYRGLAATVHPTRRPPLSFELWLQATESTRTKAT